MFRTMNNFNYTFISHKLNVYLTNNTIVHSMQCCRIYFILFLFFFFFLFLQCSQRAFEIDLKVKCWFSCFHNWYRFCSKINLFIWISFDLSCSRRKNSSSTQTHTHTHNRFGSIHFIDSNDEWMRCDRNRESHNAYMTIARLVKIACTCVCMYVCMYVYWWTLYMTFYICLQSQIFTDSRAQFFVAVPNMTLLSIHLFYL